MKLNKKITFGVAIITLLFVFTACTTPDSVGDTVDQAEMEQEARETVSALNTDAGKGDLTALESSLSDDFVYTTEDGEEGTREDIGEYFQGDDLVYFKISEDGTVKRINDDEMRIYTVLIIGLEIEGLDVVEFETDITITLEKIDGNWTITRWDEGYKGRSDQEDNDFYGEYKAKVNQRLSEIFNIIKDGEIDKLDDFLADDFEYEGPAFDGTTREVEYDRAGFISELNELNNDRKYFSELKLTIRKYDIDDDDGDLEVEIEGLLELIISDSDGQTFLNMKYDAEFEFEYIDGEWYLTEWDDDRDDDEQDNYDQAAIDATDELLNDIFLASKDRDRDSLEEYLDSDFEYEGPALDNIDREVEYNRAEFIEKVLAEEIDFIKLNLENRKYDMDDDDEVEIEGYLKMIFEYNGEEYNKSYYKAEFEFEKDNGTWYLEEWETD